VGQASRSAVHYLYQKQCLVHASLDCRQVTQIVTIFTPPMSRGKFNCNTASFTKAQNESPVFRLEPLNNKHRRGGFSREVYIKLVSEYLSITSSTQQSLQSYLNFKRRPYDLNQPAQSPICIPQLRLLLSCLASPLLRDLVMPDQPDGDLQKSSLTPVRHTR